MILKLILIAPGTLSLNGLGRAELLRGLEPHQSALHVSRKSLDRIVSAPQQGLESLLQDVLAEDPSIDHDLLGYSEDFPRASFYSSTLFRAVQLAAVFNDSKTFPDCLPRGTLRSVAKKFKRSLPFLINGGTDKLREFTLENFELPEEVAATIDARARNGESLMKYIERIWPMFVRDLSKVPKPKDAAGKSFNDPEGSSLLPLPYPVIVPGGRFREAYYWDTLFPFLVFIDDPATHDLAMGLARNMKHQIEKYGYIPNGNRDYYLGRSQMPVFGLMVKKIWQVKGKSAALEFADSLKTEFLWWGQRHDPNTGRGRRVISSLPDGDREMFIYSSEFGDEPRPEAFKEDVAKVSAVGQAIKTVHPLRAIRASCESGWDFSSRFGAELKYFDVTAETIAAVDLLSLLTHNAFLISELMSAGGNQQLGSAFRQKADELNATLNTYFYHDAALGGSSRSSEDPNPGNSSGFADFLWQRGTPSSHITAAAMMPLALGLASPAKAQVTLKSVEGLLLRRGGIMATGTFSEEQWDEPWGWAPLQLFAYAGAMNYGNSALAADIAKRWIGTVEKNFLKTGRIFEKYNVATGAIEEVEAERAGEYPTQVGFAFTNAVVQLLHKSSGNDNLGLSVLDIPGFV